MLRQFSHIDKGGRCISSFCVTLCLAQSVRGQLFDIGVCVCQLDMLFVGSEERCMGLVREFI